MHATLIKLFVLGPYLMPEKGVVALFRHKVNWTKLKRQISSKVDLASPGASYAHVSPSDPSFTQLPIMAGHSSSGYYCNSCYSASDEDKEDPKPSVEDDNNFTLEDSVLANTLSISGHIYAKNCGEELAIVICNPITYRNFVMPINFGTEAHVFWMPTEWYQKIFLKPAIHRGKKKLCLYYAGQVC
ncbi:hypothetical protein B0H16DRAFT_1484235 [Mycena metata]|uniref:Uncharacterized protein n=1 Tax=Mycena metata TaxID=1033252 RepID=A0AAD7DTQ7_9AGAR|nr:hypothetical protein B0H16DRAFT_1484235 [Mycena metata]